MESKYPFLLQQAIAEITGHITAFSPEMVNAVPFEGSWSAGQVTIHVLKSIEGLPSLFSAGSIATERDPHQFEEMLEKTFLDFGTKMKSPEFILPGDGPFEKSTLLTRLTTTADAINRKVKDLDLSQTFHHFSFPGMGSLTGYELLCFAYAHVTRHAQQVKKIYDHLKSNPTFKSGVV